MKKSTAKKALVIGASGYTGSSLVEHLSLQGFDVIAHIRPDSKSLEKKTDEFGKFENVVVDTTPWQLDAFRKTLAAMKPDFIFSTLGTTRARKTDAVDPEKETYHEVDYKLTVMVIGACVEEKLHPKFVYLSAVGVNSKSMSKYMQARFHLEEYLAMSGLDYTVARPSFVSGSDREESRPGERIATVLGDSLLTAASIIGFRGLKKKYSSMTGEELALAMIHLAEDDAFNNRHADPNDLIKYLK